MIPCLFKQQIEASFKYRDFYWRGTRLFQFLMQLEVYFLRSDCLAVVIDSNCWSGGHKYIPCPQLSQSLNFSCQPEKQHIQVWQWIRLLLLVTKRLRKAVIKLEDVWKPFQLILQELAYGHIATTIFLKRKRLSIIIPIVLLGDRYLLSAFTPSHRQCEAEPRFQNRKIVNLRWLCTRGLGLYTDGAFGTGTGNLSFLSHNYFLGGTHTNIEATGRRNLIFLARGISDPCLYFCDRGHASWKYRNS